MTAKLTKEQRARLITDHIRMLVAAMSDDVVLAVHDYLHEEMLRRNQPKPRSTEPGFMPDWSHE